SGPGSWLTMVDTMRKTAHSKPLVPPGMCRSLYKRDYWWCEEYKPPNEEDSSQLKAKEFAIPQEGWVVTYSGSILWQGREVIPALRTFSPTSVFPVTEGYLPKYHPATKLAVALAEVSERLEAGAEPEKRLPAAVQTAGTAETFLHRQKLTLGWTTYQQFTLEMCRARQHGWNYLPEESFSYLDCLSVDCFDLDWRSTYNTNFQHWPGAHSGCCRENKGLSYIFPEDEHLNQ
ncbi:hypothetical protein N324_01543, partial [Chlamydotis macqueenii]